MLDSLTVLIQMLRAMECQTSVSQNTRIEIRKNVTSTLKIDRSRGRSRSRRRFCDRSSRVRDRSRRVRDRSRRVRDRNRVRDRSRRVRDRSSRVSDRSRGLETGTGLEIGAGGLQTGAGGLQTEAEETEKGEEIAKLTSGRAGHSSITWSSTAEDSVGVVGTLSRAVCMVSGLMLVQ